MYEFLQSASYVVAGMTIFLALIAFTAYPKVDKALKLFCIYFIVAGSTEIIAFAQELYSGENISILHYFAFFECLILIKVFHFLYNELGIRLNLSYLLYPMLTLIVIITLFLQNIENYNSFSGALVSAVILILSVYYFYLILDKEKEIEFASAKKWILILIFMYHVTLFIFTIFGNFILEMESATVLNIWLVRFIIIFIVKLLLIYQVILLLMNHKLAKNKIVHE